MIKQHTKKGKNPMTRVLSIKLPSQDELIALIDYDPSTGVGLWKPRDQEMFVHAGQHKRWHGMFNGKQLGYRCRLPGFDSATILSHRIFFKIGNGYDPEVVDHDNGDHRDNRLINLVDSSDLNNSHNQCKPVNNTSGLTGVYVVGSGYIGGARINGEFKQKKFDKMSEAYVYRKNLIDGGGFSNRHGVSSISASKEWLKLLSNIMSNGLEVAPRGLVTYEIIGNQYSIDMMQPVVQIPMRKMSYKFAAAEAHWIISGSNDLEYIKKYAPSMVKFSDDGIFLSGAYGPAVVDQFPYIIKTLIDDPMSRSAYIDIWRKRPYSSKDIGCTLGLQFLIRGNKLHCLASMRSSDAWLGVIYDTVTFSCIAQYVVSLLRKAGYKEHLIPGNLTLTAGSQHLYESNFDTVNAVIKANEEGDVSNEDPRKLLFLFENEPKDIVRLLRNYADQPEGIMGLMS